jgi:signal transduction histidine kinase
MNDEAGAEAGSSSFIVPRSSFVFAVADTGIGMSAEQMARLFEAFS